MLSFIIIATIDDSIPAAEREAPSRRTPCNHLFIVRLAVLVDDDRAPTLHAAVRAHEHLRIALVPVTSSPLRQHSRRSRAFLP